MEGEGRRTHDGRLNSVDMVRHNPRKRLDPVALDRLLAHDHIRRRTITDPTRVSSRDGSVLGKDGRELGELLEGDGRARVLVLLEDDRLAALLLRGEGDGCDLALESARVESCAKERVSGRGSGANSEGNADAPCFHRC